MTWHQTLSLWIHWRLSATLKTSNKNVWSNVFWYVKVWIFWKCIQYTIHCAETNVKKIPFGQNNRCKKCPLFFFLFRELQLITALFLLCDSYMRWSTRFVSLKLFVEFSILDSASFLLKLIFFSTKCIESLTLKRHNSF